MAKISMEEYLAMRAFSGGLAATLLADSPFAAWYSSPWNPDRPRSDSNAADNGTAAHSILLEGSEACLAVIDPEQHRSKPTKAEPDGSVPTGWTNGAMRAARDAAHAEGKTPILPSRLAEIRAMVDAARSFVATTELRDIWTGGEPELTFTWAEAGVPCKIRPDMLSADRRVILSYKTTPGSAEPNAWIRRILPQHEVGMALYERGIAACCGVERPRVVHLIQSQERPYACSLVALAPSRQEYAERQLDAALAIWRGCLETKRFPSYPPMIHYAELSAWQAANMEEQMMEAADTLEMEA